MRRERGRRLPGSAGAQAATWRSIELIAALSHVCAHPSQHATSRRRRIGLESNRHGPTAHAPRSRIDRARAPGADCPGSLIARHPPAARARCRMPEATVGRQHRRPRSGRLRAGPTTAFSQALSTASPAIAIEAGERRAWPDRTGDQFAGAAIERAPVAGVNLCVPIIEGDRARSTRRSRSRRPGRSAHPYRPSRSRTNASTTQGMRKNAGSPSPRHRLRAVDTQSAPSRRRGGNPLSPRQQLVMAQPGPRNHPYRFDTAERGNWCAVQRPLAFNRDGRAGFPLQRARKLPPCS